MNVTATHHISALSLHDALPIWAVRPILSLFLSRQNWSRVPRRKAASLDARSRTDARGAFGVSCECSVRARAAPVDRSEEHTSELQSRRDLVCRLLLEKKKSILL